MNKIDELIKQIKAADAILVGGGIGISDAAGMDFWYSADSQKYFGDFYQKYHFNGLFQGYYNHFDSLEKNGLSF